MSVATKRSKSKTTYGTSTTYRTIQDQQTKTKNQLRRRRRSEEEVQQHRSDRHSHQDITTMKLLPSSLVLAAIGEMASAASDGGIIWSSTGGGWRR